MNKKHNSNKVKQTKAAQVSSSVKLKESLFPVKKLQMLIILAFTFLLYGNTIGFDYTLDDAIVITDNKFTQKGFEGIKDILTKDTFFGFFGENKQLVSGGRYRPLSLVTFAVEYEFFGKTPLVSHFINILLYAGTGILLLLLLYELFPAALTSFFNIPFLTSLLFLAHPLHTEVVANIKGRDEIMCFLGLIGMVYFLYRYLLRKDVYNLVISLLIYFFALMSKENAITFLALVPLFLYFFSKENLKKILVLSSLYLVPSLIFWSLRGHFTKSSVNMEVTEVLNNPFVYMTAVQKYATVVFTWGKYLLLLIFPHPLTHDYYYNQITPKAFTNISVIIVLLVHAALAFFAVKEIKKKSILAFGILFYFITFSVVSNLLFPIGTFMSERFVYISSFGFVIILASILVKYFAPKITNEDTLKPTSTINKKIFIVSVLVLTGYSFKTITRNDAWKDNYTLFTTDIETSPNSAKLRNSVGGELSAYADKETDPVKKKELLQKSISNLKRALEIYPQYTGAWLLLGNAYYKLDNQYEKAIECYQQIIKILPNQPDAYLNLGITYRQIGNTYASNKNLLRYLTYKPTDADAYYMIGENCKKHNQPDSAIAFLVKAVEFKPSSDTYREIGSIYGQIKNDINSAEFYLKKALELNPKDRMALENLAIVYGIKKEFDKAIEIFNKSLELDPHNAGVLRNIAVTYAQKGDKENAEKYFAKANEAMGKR